MDGGGAAGALRAPPLPCLYNTLLRVGDVRWSTTPGGAADRLAVAGCPLRRYSAQEARRCLAGKRLVFVGDSVTRCACSLARAPLQSRCTGGLAQPGSRACRSLGCWPAAPKRAPGTASTRTPLTPAPPQPCATRSYQYLTLLHFVERGRWPAPLGGVPGDPSVANEHEWPRWEAVGWQGGREFLRWARRAVLRRQGAQAAACAARAGARPPPAAHRANPLLSRPRRAPPCALPLARAAPHTRSPPNRSWNDFLLGSSALFGGREACDCYRAEARPEEGWKPPESEKFENRFYRDPAAGLSSEPGCCMGWAGSGRLAADGRRQGGRLWLAHRGAGAGDSHSRANAQTRSPLRPSAPAVSHFTYTTEPNTVHGHYGFPPYEGEAGKGRRPCAPATCSAPADWDYGLAAVSGLGSA